MDFNNKKDIESIIKNFDTNLNNLIEIIDFQNNSIVKHNSKNSNIIHKQVIDPALLLSRIKNESNPEIKKQLEEKLKNEYPDFDTANFMITSYNKNENSTELKIQGSHGELFDLSYNALLKTDKKYTFLYSSSVVSLISSVEVFFSQLLHIYLSKHPFYAIKEKEIKIKEIFDNNESLAVFENEIEILNNLTEKVLENIRDNNDRIISDFIDRFIRGGFIKWINEFKKLGIKLGLNTELIDISNEIFQRRHSIIHSNSEVDSKYIELVNEKLIGNYVKGDKLKTDYKYISNAIDTLELTFLLISIPILQKVGFSSFQIYSLLVNIAYNNLKSNRWKFVNELSFYIYNEREEKDNIRTVSYIALVFSSKKLGNDIEVKDKEFVDKSVRFQLYYYALKNDHENFLKNLKNMDEKKNILIEIDQIPIFKEVLNNKDISEYIESIKIVEPTKTKIIPIKSNNK